MSGELPPEIAAEVRRRLANAKPRPSPCEHMDGLRWSKYAGRFVIWLRDGRTYLPISYCPFCGIRLGEEQ